jgi:anti-anti-sigma factor
MSEQASTGKHLASFTSWRSEDRAVLHLRGELDLSSVSELERELDAVFGEDGREPIVVDLSELAFMDSTGLALLVRTRNRAAELGRELRLRAARGQVRRLFELASLSDAFTFAD